MYVTGEIEIVTYICEFKMEIHPQGREIGFSTYLYKIITPSLQ